MLLLKYVITILNKYSVYPRHHRYQRGIKKGTIEYKQQTAINWENAHAPKNKGTVAVAMVISYLPRHGHEEYHDFGPSCTTTNKISEFFGYHNDHHPLDTFVIETKFGWLKFKKYVNERKTKTPDK